MKITFTQNLNHTPDFLIRRCGYGQVRDPRATEISYARRLGGGFYPRFHLYVNSVQPLVLNLHLDQKQVSYEGQTAHSGDYDSDLVKQEAQRIYNQIIKESQAAPVEEYIEEKKGIFDWLFGKK